MPYSFIELKNSQCSVDEQSRATSEAEFSFYSRQSLKRKEDYHEFPRKAGRPGSLQLRPAQCLSIQKHRPFPSNINTQGYFSARAHRHASRLPSLASPQSASAYTFTQKILEKGPGLIFGCGMNFFFLGRYPLFHTKPPFPEGKTETYSSLQ